MKQVKYRLVPSISGSYKKQWKLVTVTVLGPNAETTNTVGYFRSIKAAKTVVAHFRRKPIDL